MIYALLFLSVMLQGLVYFMALCHTAKRADAAMDEYFNRRNIDK